MVTVLPSAEVSWPVASCGTMLSFSSMSNSLSQIEAKTMRADIGARQRRIQHIRVLGEADAQHRLLGGRTRQGGREEEGTGRPGERLSQRDHGSCPLSVRRVLRSSTG